MSAVPPIATELVTRGSPSLGGHFQTNASQQTGPSFDYFVRAHKHRHLSDAEFGAAPATCSGGNHRIRKRKSSRCLRYSAPQIYLEARIERPGRMAHPTARCAVNGFTPLLRRPGAGLTCLCGASFSHRDL